MKKVIMLVAASVVLLIAGCTALGLPGVPVALLFGWAAFLARVLPQVSVEWPTVGVACTAVIVFVTGVQLAGWMWTRPLSFEGSSRQHHWRLRWSLAGVPVLLVLFGAGIALVAIVHQIVWLIRSNEPVTVSMLKPRTGSKQNLESVAVALGAYGDSYGVFPQGGTFAADGTMRHGWATYVLAFLGYTADIDLNSPWNSPRNEKYFKCVIPQFINQQLAFPADELFDAQGFGFSHYAANSRLLNAGKPFVRWDLEDTRTLMIGEVNADFKPWGHPLNWRDPADGINQSTHGFGGPWYAHGANFAMADGSVRFINELVDREVLRALAAPAGRKQIDALILQSPK